jgi:hypothetical protein
MASMYAHNSSRSPVWIRGVSAIDLVEFLDDVGDGVEHGLVGRILELGDLRLERVERAVDRIHGLWPIFGPS